MSTRTQIREPRGRSIQGLEFVAGECCRGASHEDTIEFHAAGRANKSRGHVRAVRRDGDDTDENHSCAETVPHDTLNLVRSGGIGAAWARIFAAAVPLWEMSCDKGTAARGSYSCLTSWKAQLASAMERPHSSQRKARMGHPGLLRNSCRAEHTGRVIPRSCRSATLGRRRRGRYSVANSGSHRKGIHERSRRRNGCRHACLR